MAEDEGQRQQLTQDESFANRQYQQTNQDRDEEIVQVVYQSDQHGALVGVESTSLLGSSSSTDNFQAETGNYREQHATSPNGAAELQTGESIREHTQMIGSYHEQLTRAASTLPSVAEEPSNVGPVAEVVEPAQDTGFAREEGSEFLAFQDGQANLSDNKENNLSQASFAAQEVDGGLNGLVDSTHQYSNVEPNQAQAQAPIYSTIRRSHSDRQQEPNYTAASQPDQFPADIYNGSQEQQQAGDANKNLIDYDGYEQTTKNSELYEQRNSNDGNGSDDEAARIGEEIGHILSRHRAGAVEKGSFRNNFRKKLGLSASTNENDLTAYRQKLLETSQDPNSVTGEQFSNSTATSGQDSDTEHLGSLPSKFKRNHSVSFNVHSSRSRHSVDIRNLPSYLTHKRASIVDVARGAMSSLMSSLGSGAGGGSGSGSAISGSQRRESTHDEEPIFEEPIAPTLSLGQRVAMVRNVGAEFGTVGWIGQFPDVDDDWIVGVIFDNMIGDCDGAYNGVRYFYARENYAMFVPLSTLTKTDNYIGRPETGTMLSRMSVSLKPGQLISIQRSSIRLQHCFLNAPHQRVGHDVRAVSNRLHCQCHNCGPCAHLTKQGRINALPHFGAHHLPHKKKNSLAHAAVEMLAHHHHHFHEEEEHDEKDYEFGDNAAHACNFVRYSCCQQTGSRGHEFSRDCEMVRPELLDNLIHAPKAPHRRHSRPRGRVSRARRLNQLERPCGVEDKARLAALEGSGTNPPSNTATLEANQSTLDRSIMTEKSSEFDATGEAQLAINAADAPLDGDEGVGGDQDDDKSDGQSSYLSSGSSHGSGSSRSVSPSREAPLNQQAPYNYYQYDTASFRPTGSVYNTINSQISFLDQQRFVYQRDSAAMVQSPKPSHYETSDSYDTSNFSEPRGVASALGIKRILRCLGCLRQQSGRRRRRRRKLSFRDRVLEYRRRQSTFVPSTLAKPHEDFASHGIVLPSSSGGGRASRHNKQPRNGEVNSDYSSCSRSSCSSSRSNSPPNYPPTSAACLNATIPMQTQDHSSIQPNRHTAGTMALEHEQASSDYQLKSGQYQQPSRNDQDSFSQPQLDYGDFTFGEGYQTYEKSELSKDSALTEFGFSDTCKSNSSSDTLKHLVDQSVNEQVSLPQPLPENFNEMISPLSSASTHPLGQDDQESPHSRQYEISSPTASVADNANLDEACEDQGALEKDFVGLNLGSNE